MGKYVTQYEIGNDDTRAFYIRTPLPQYNNVQASSIRDAVEVLVADRRYSQETRVTGKKHLAVCNGIVEEHDTLDAAQSAAEALAHKHGTDAYVLKPIRKVAPKRDVVTTEL